MKDKTKFAFAVFNVAVFLAVLLIIPYASGFWGFLLLSWIPASIVFDYLNQFIK